MGLSQYGSSISAVRATSISAHGVWLLAHGKELFMSCDDFLWFEGQSIKSIINVEEPSPGHFCWPDIGGDVTEEIIENPEKFPSKAKNK